MNPLSGPKISNFITKMTKNDAMGPIVALEATVIAGRTLQAYKRGGEDEARERVIEETTGSVVWLGGVKFLNWIGDKILGKVFGGNFEVGTDNILRTPFKNFMSKQPPKGLSAKQVAIIKAIKVLSSVLLADAFIGLVVPPLNQKLTRNSRAKREAKHQQQEEVRMKNNNKQSAQPSFKGALEAINIFTNAIENTNTGKLLSTDAGLVSGRMYSARNNTERKEIAIRDIGSIYFYMWAQNHVAGLLNFIETGKFSRLDPTSVATLDKYLMEFLEKSGGEMNVADFKNLVLGNKDNFKNLPENIKFETAELSKIQQILNKYRKAKIEPLQVAKVKDLETIITDSSLMSRIREMAKLQPERMGESVITKQQIVDAMNKCEINNPKLLDEVFSQFTEGASKDEYRYVSNKKLYDLKQRMEDYVDDICKKAKNGKINKEVLKNAKNRNIAWSGVNFVTGFVVAATFLSTLIPKFQYWYTKHTTGQDLFPGVIDE